MVNRTLSIVVLAMAGSLVGLALFGAQDSGNIFGTVTDTGGNALPGSTVTLTGFGGKRYQTTDSNGGFRFLGLDPGVWEVKAELHGYSTVDQPNLVVSVNRNTEIVLSLSTAIQESITVTAESPLLDERKVSAGTTISQVELEKIPSTRDPWAVMQQAPGVLTDRINVGGNLSGTQQFFTGAGTDKTQNAYYVDGGDITDRFGNGGFSSTYFDFDQFSEMQLHTGGSDVTREVPGVSINLVTKRGSNEFRGSARFLLTDPDGYFGALKQWQRRPRSRRPRPGPEPGELRSEPGRPEPRVRLRGRRPAVAQPTLGLGLLGIQRSQLLRPQRLTRSNRAGEYRHQAQRPVLACEHGGGLVQQRRQAR